jgi:WD40 repeat protein
MIGCDNRNRPKGHNETERVMLFAVISLAMSFLPLESCRSFGNGDGRGVDKFQKIQWCGPRTLVAYDASGRLVLIATQATTDGWACSTRAVVPLRASIDCWATDVKTGFITLALDDKTVVSIDTARLSAKNGPRLHCKPSAMASSAASGLTILGLEDGTVSIFETATLKNVYTAKTFDQAVQCLSWHEDGSRVAISEGTTCAIYRYDNPTLRKTSFHLENCHSLRFLSDKMCAVTRTTDGVVDLLEVSSMRRVGSLSADCILAGFACCDHGLHYVMSGDEAVKVTIGVPPRVSARRLHHAECLDMALSPDRSVIATCGTDNTICILDAKTFELTYPPKGHVSTLSSLSIRGNTLISADRRGVVCAWELPSGRLKWSQACHDGWITSVGMDAKRALVLSGGADSSIHIAHSGGGRIETIARDEQVCAAALSPSGEYIACDGPGVGSVDIIDRRSSAVVRRLPVPSRSVIDYLSYSPDGRYLASVDRGGRLTCVWDVVHDYRPRIHVEAKGPNVYTGLRIRTAAYSPDSRFIAGFGGDGRLGVWELASGRIVCNLDVSQWAGPSKEGDAAAGGIGFVLDGQLIAILSTHDKVLLADWLDNRVVCRLDVRGASSFAADGPWIAVGKSDTTVQVLKVRSDLGRWIDDRRSKEPIREELTAVWKRIEARDPAISYQAIRQIAAQRSWNVVKGLVPLPSDCSDELIVKYIGDLDSTDFHSRERAFSRLAKSFDQAKPSVETALRNPKSAGQREMLLKLIEVGIADSQEQLVRARLLYFLSRHRAASGTELIRMIAESSRFDRTSVAARSLLQTTEK